MHVKHNINPVYSNDSKVLILGSLPSVISRKENFYYANKSNRFWQIFSILFNTSFNCTEDKINFLLANKIALWDVIYSCDINNSKDESIKNIKVNDIEEIIKKSEIKIIFCTGKKSFQTYQKYLSNKIKLPCIYLASPSSANAMKSIANLVQEYQIIKDCLK